MLFLRYVEKFFLESKPFQAKFVEKIETNFISDIFSPQIVPSVTQCGNYSRGKKATDENVIHGAEMKQFAPRITKTGIQTHTHNM